MYDSAHLLRSEVSGRIAQIQQANEDKHNAFCFLDHNCLWWEFQNDAEDLNLPVHVFFNE